MTTHLDMPGRWAPIPGHPGYFASDEGQIASVKIWRGSAQPRLRREHLNRGGYPSVSLMVDGSPKTLRVHTLVALAFHGPCPDGQEVRHLDGDRTHNRPANLAYGTRSENNRDAVQHGTHFQASKTHCPQSHAYTEANTFTVPSRPDARYCMECARIRSREYKRRRRAAA